MVEKCVHIVENSRPTSDGGLDMIPLMNILTHSVNFVMERQDAYSVLVSLICKVQRKIRDAHNGPLSSRTNYITTVLRRCFF